MRVALTLDRDAVGRERNDYVTSLLAAGFRREEIEVVGPGAAPAGAIDGLVLGGGCDVDPARYGETIREGAGVEVDPGRDALDFDLLARARAEGIPVLAICRGLQVVNVALGGTLVQDLPSQRPSPVEHETEAGDKTRIRHAVSVAAGTRLAAATLRTDLPVNSRHHQAIARPAPGLVVTATSDDGVIEAAEASSGPWLVAVQWHPENLAAQGDPASLGLFREFARLVRERAGLDETGPAVPESAVSS
jgi:putative glutamine amidotransferase